MSLSDFATFSTAISGLAVTASLIYLALQTHQNAKHTKALIHQGRASRIVELAMAATRSDLVEAAIAANGEEPTLDKIRRRQFGGVCRAFVLSFEESFFQYRNGLLEKEVYDSLCVNIANRLAYAPERAEWQIRKTPGTDFTKFVDAIIARTTTA